MPPQRGKRKATEPPAILTASSQREEVESWLKASIPLDLADQVCRQPSLPPSLPSLSSFEDASTCFRSLHRGRRPRLQAAAICRPPPASQHAAASIRGPCPSLQLIIEWNARGELFDGQTLLEADEQLLIDTGASRTVAKRILLKIREVGGASWSPPACSTH